MSLTLRVDKTWDGRPCEAIEVVEIELRVDADELHITIDAPYHGDAPPPGPAGSYDGLWEYEVVEVFLLGGADNYVELEFAPHGHYLALALLGPRRRLGELPIEYYAHIVGERWRGSASIPRATLPDAVTALNAYAIHGKGDARRYLAHAAVPGDAPDFHRLEHFAPTDFFSS